MDGLRRRSVLGAFGGTVAAGGAMGGTFAGAGAARAAERGSRPAAAPAARRHGEHDAKVRELLGRMTVEEKLGQLQQLSWNGDTGPGGGQNKEAVAAARKGMLSSVLNLKGAKDTNDLQRIAVEESRLGIPILFGLDVINGYWTTFPTSLAEASSFDPSVAEREGEVAAKEARSNGIRWTFTPMMDVCHEPRWGRIVEGMGEDPFLASTFAVSKIKGLQGDDIGSDDRIAACAKHFVAYGGAEGGRDYNTVDVSEARLRNLYLPPFKAAVEAGVATVMASFNTISGVPAHGNSHTLTEILRDEWGFDGFVVSDWDGIREMIPHGFAADGADAGALGLGAGVDMEMVSTTLVDNGKKLLREGRIDVKRLDEAVANILRVKYALGLFDHPYTDEDAASDGPTKATRKVAREVAGRSMVLLRNEGGALPLSRSVGSVAVVGPYADSRDLQRGWSGPGAGAYPAVTLRDGVAKAVPGAHVSYARGTDEKGEDTGGIAEAVAAAKAADVTVIAVGEPPGYVGEAASRSDISLPGGQEKLIAAIAKTGKPFIVVLVNGRPLTVGDWVEQAPAVLEAWQPGIEGGNAIADVLFGAVNPGGKLPVSFPRSTGQIPVYYNHENTGRPYDPDNFFTSKYLDLEHGPRFVFGHGLSYTTFEVGDPQLSRSRISAHALRKGDTVQVAVPVHNTGKRAGDEVVQVYLHDPVASVVQPVRRLRGFKRVTLKAGESTTVRIQLSGDDLG
ncbi:MAG TPA: beta-glucosidase BglX, partial [Streptomyces sp.]|nr:beta-glucosidase BglX [Streptomyces sp.]